MAKKTRRNPAKTQAGRVLRIENCPPSLASRLLTDRARAINAGEKPPTRYGNCDYRAAEWALQLSRKHGYKEEHEKTFKPAAGAKAFQTTAWGNWLSNIIDAWW